LILQTLVEGKGEETAVPALLRRLRDECGDFSLAFDRPIRRSRSELVQERPLRATVRTALRQERGCDAILILFDSDKDCPKDLAAKVQAWGQAEAGRIPCQVVIAHHEYEAWFLAALESLRGRRGVREDARAHPEPESMRGVKARLSASMERPYHETLDQAAFTALFDLAAAYRSCRSFRRMVRAFGLLAAAAGAELSAWPPPSWRR
jgi:hypothetical protein